MGRLGTVTRNQIRLKCITCGEWRSITTNHLHLYTEEVRRTWTCALHHKDRVIPKGSVVKEGATMDEQKQNEQSGIVEEQGVKGQPEIVLEEETLKKAVMKFPYTKKWKAIIIGRYDAGAKTITPLMAAVEEIVMTKVRSKNPDDLEKRREDMRQGAKKVLAKAFPDLGIIAK